MSRRSGTEQIAKAVPVALTLVLMASMGGGFLGLPLLIPGHMWAARRSQSSLGRVGWSVLPAVAIGILAWAAVYVLVGETKPVIWLVPGLSSIATLVLVVRSTTIEATAAALGRA